MNEHTTPLDIPDDVDSTRDYMLAERIARTIYETQGHASIFDNLGAYHQWLAAGGRELGERVLDDLRAHAHYEHYLRSFHESDGDPCTSQE